MDKELAAEDLVKRPFPLPRLLSVEQVKEAIGLIRRRSDLQDVLCSIIRAKANDSETYSDEAEAEMRKCRIADLVRSIARINDSLRGLGVDPGPAPVPDDWPLAGVYEAKLSAD